MFTWLKGIWDAIKPGVKATLRKVIANQLQPALAVFIAVQKDKLIADLQNYSAADNAKKACDWLNDYFERQL